MSDSVSPLCPAALCLCFLYKPFVNHIFPPSCTVNLLTELFISGMYLLWFFFSNSVLWVQFLYFGWTFFIPPPLCCFILYVFCDHTPDYSFKLPELIYTVFSFWLITMRLVLWVDDNVFIFSCHLFLCLDLHFWDSLLVTSFFIVTQITFLFSCIGIQMFVRTLTRKKLMLCFLSSICI